MAGRHTWEGPAAGQRLRLPCLRVGGLPAWGGAAYTTGVKFLLVDKLLSVAEDRSSLEASKHVTLAEEYLADHFESFPVLPGVMMLECAVQSAAWLLHLRSGFAKSVAVLKEAKNVRYGNFVAPGDALTMTVDLLKEVDGGGATFKFAGQTGSGSQAVSGRLELSYFNLAEKDADTEAADARLIEHHRHRWTALTSANPPATPIDL